MSTILIIDDEPVIRSQVAEILQYEDFTVYEAANGLEGIQAAQQHIPDLIICDVMMPELDGFAVLRELRSRSQTTLIPFIFLSALGNRADTRKGMELGADDYLTKPFTRNDLLNSVRIRLQKQSELKIQKLHQLAQHLIELEEKERRSLAQALHDEIVEMLTSLKVSLSIGRSQQSGLTGSALLEIEQLTDQLIDRVNILSLNLYPTMLHHLGLVHTLIWLFDRFTEQTGIQVHFDQRHLDTPIPTETKLTVYRILQEALSNVYQHANTDAVTVQCWTQDRSLYIQVEDGGIGFSVEDKLWVQGSNGLLMMQERARKLNGEIHVSSSSHRGTQITIQFPIGETNTLQPTRQTILAPVSHPTPVPRQAVKVILADRQEIVRRGLRTILEAQPNLLIVGEATDGAEALALVEQHNPDVLVIDLMMTEFYALGDLTNASPQTRIIILSTQQVDAYIMEALRSGAAGYVLKDASGTELIEAIQQVIAGHRYLSPALKDRALDSFFSDNLADYEDFSTLTRREREILNLLVEGHRNAEIAEKLFISPRTAETHRANIMRKLGVRTQAELVRYTMQRGWVK